METKQLYLQQTYLECIQDMLKEKKWKIEIIEKQDGELGGIKEIAFTIIGLGAYSRLKFESGVHRVQRVPKTEASGRIHTSTATVAVLPEVEDVQEVTVDPKDFKNRYI